MTSLDQPDSNPTPVIFPILSIRRFFYLVGIPRDKIEKVAENSDIFYSPFTKQTGGKPRLIDNPTGILKQIQQNINQEILNHICFPDFVIGGIKGRKPTEHPQRHVNKKVVVTLDVKECFPSVTNSRIFEVWYKDLGCSSEVARLATKLTTTKGHLPLGAPTSNLLSNLALLPCIKKVVEIAESYGFSTEAIGQYIDDLAFSGDYLHVDFITDVIREFSRHGYRIKRSKVKVMRSSEPQIVTNKLVNTRVSLPRQERGRIRSALHQLSRMDSGDSTYPKLYRSVRGRINYLSSLHATLGKGYLEKMAGLTNPDKL